MVKSKDSKGKKSKHGRTQSTSGAANSPRAVEINYDQTLQNNDSNGEAKDNETKDNISALQVLHMMSKATLILACGSFINVSLQLALQPLWGSVPLGRFYKQIMLAGPVVSGFAPELSRFKTRWNERSVLGYLGVMCLLGPKLCFYVAMIAGRMGSVSLGPVVTLVLLAMPFSAFSIVLIKFYLVSSRISLMYFDH